MNNATDALQQQIEQLIADTLTDSELETALTALANAQPDHFRALAPIWTAQLIERSPYTFATFIKDHLTLEQHSDLIESLLAEAERVPYDSLFTTLYELVGSPERWYADVARLIQSAPDFDTIVHGLMVRIKYQQVLSEDALIALYERDPKGFVQNFHYALTSQGYSRYFTPPAGNLEKFRAVVAANGSTPDFSNHLFRQYATDAEWQAEARKLLDKKPEKIVERLGAIQPERENADLPDDLQQSLINRFGDAVKQYLDFLIPRRFRAMIVEMLRAEPDNARLMDHLNKLRSANWSRFYNNVCVWAPLLYERDAAYFGAFILLCLRTESPCVGELTMRARRDGHRELYTGLAARWDNPLDWNADVQSVLNASPTPAVLLRELERLDVKRNGRYYTAKIALTDTNAAALYQYAPEVSREFVWRYLSAQAVGAYEQLLRVVREDDDQDFFIRLLRRVTTQEQWNQELERLLSENLPPAQVLAELEKRKPADTNRIQPTILHRFLNQYGEAVLPFFENYMDWATPERLRSLLDLDIERGALLKELNAISRRQPLEFAQYADVWAMRLYEMSPEFFGPFVVKHLGRGSGEAGRQMLSRLEADERYTLFRDLFPTFYFGGKWEEEITRLLRTEKDDARLLAALERRTSEWAALPDRLAAALYKRNPAVFREYVMKHARTVRFSYELDTFEGLRAAAESAGDRELVNHLSRTIDSDAFNRQQLRALVEQKLPFEQLEAQAKAIAPAGLATIFDKALITWLLKRYGDALMPLLIPYAVGVPYRRTQSLPELEIVQAHVSEANYWRYLLASREHTAWIAALHELAAAPLSDTAFAARLAMMTPDSSMEGILSGNTAAALYRRSPELTRPFIQRFLGEPHDPALFIAATEHHDDTLLDVLTYQALLSFNRLVRNTSSSPIKPEENYRTPAERAAPFIARLDRLYDESPSAFTAHAAYILSFIQPRSFGWGDQSAPNEKNPLWQALVRRHHPAWRADASAIRALLESPSIYVQLVALDLLSEPLTPDEAPDAAAVHVVENLRAFRVLLLSNTLKETKRKTLACLEAAAHVSNSFREPITQMLQTVLDFTTARRAISDDIGVMLARLTLIAPYAIEEA